MSEKEDLKKAYEKTAKEWESLSLSKKKDKVIKNLQERFDGTKRSDHKMFYSNLIISIEMSEGAEATQLVDSIHHQIMNHALQLMNES